MPLSAALCGVEEGPVDVPTWLDSCRNWERQTPGHGDFTLETVRCLLAEAGMDAPPCSVLVAGTNGKGTVATAVAACLARAGYRTGLYLSPHLIDLRERIQVAGCPISTGDLESAFRSVRPALEARREQVTWFEALTLVGLAHFRAAGAEAGVLEVGLGGRLDATNALSRVLQVVTSIDLDHTHILGRDRASIAREKAGIVAPGVPVIAGALPRSASEVLEAVARERGAPLFLRGREWDVRIDREGFLTVDLRGRRLAGLEGKLAGRHQKENLGLAAAAALLAGELGGLGVDEGAVRASLRDLDLPGRFQRVPWAGGEVATSRASACGGRVRVLPGRGERPKGGEVVLDIAHNPAAIRGLVRTCARTLGGRPLHLVFGAMQDKDIRGMARALRGTFESVHLAPLEVARGASVEVLRAAFAATAPEVEVHAGVGSALEAAALRMGQEAGFVVVTGSAYLVGEALRAMGCSTAFPNLQRARGT